jgi:CcmD family protein
MENSAFIFAAYSVIWAVVFGYVFFLVRKQAGLKRRLDSIEDEMRKKQGS